MEAEPLLRGLSHSSKAWVHIYGDRATLERFEPKYLLQRSEKKEEKGGS